MTNSLSLLPDRIQRPAGVRVYLQLLKPDQAKELYAVTNDPAITETVSFLSYPVDPRFADEWIAKNAGTQERIYGIFALDGQLAGQLGVHLAAQSTAVELGYWVGSSFKGQGFASSALQLVVQELREIYPALSVFAECRPDNAASLKVLAKSGFVPTGESGKRQSRIRLEPKF